MRKMTPFIIATLTVLLIPIVAYGAAQVTLETTVEKREVVVSDDKEEVRFVTADNAAPGDQLRFTLTFSNIGDTVANEVVIDNPIPANAFYLVDTATSYQGIVPLFSIDNGAVFDAPEKLKIIKEAPDGSRETIIAPPEKYTHIRWQLPPIPAGAAGQVSFNVRIQ